MSITIDQQFVEFIVKSLVGNPDAVQIERRIDEKGVLLELTVDPEDLGRVIGKRGATAQSLRTLLRALGTKNEARYNLKIIDNGEPRPPREDRQTDDSYQDSDHSQSPAPLAPSSVPSTDHIAPAQTDNSTWASTPPVQNDDDDDLPSTASSTANHDSLINKTRKELEDLDDLDL